MKRFYFRIYQNGDADGENIWVDAYDEESARAQVYSDYWGIDQLDLIRVK